MLGIVGYFHLPVVPRSQSAVEALQKLACRYRGFFPCRAMVWQFLAFKVGLRSVMVDVEVISRHHIKMRMGPVGSRVQRPLLARRHQSRRGEPVVHVGRCIELPDLPEQAVFFRAVRQLRCLRSKPGFFSRNI